MSKIEGELPRPWNMVGGIIRIKYSFDNAGLSTLINRNGWPHSLYEIQQTIRIAIAEWEEKTGQLRFSEEGYPAIKFTARRLNGIYAYTYCSHDVISVIYSNATRWAIFDDHYRITGGIVDLCTVTLHELAHCLALEHVNDQSAVIYDRYTGVKRLTDVDIKAFREKYGGYV